MIYDIKWEIRQTRITKKNCCGMKLILARNENTERERRREREMNVKSCTMFRGNRSKMYMSYTHIEMPLKLTWVEQAVSIFILQNPFVSKWLFIEFRYYDYKEEEDKKMTSSFPNRFFSSSHRRLCTFCCCRCLY